MEMVHWTLGDAWALKVMFFLVSTGRSYKLLSPQIDPGSEETRMAHWEFIDYVGALVPTEDSDDAVGTKAVEYGIRLRESLGRLGLEYHKDDDGDTAQYLGP